MAELKAKIWHEAGARREPRAFDGGEMVWSNLEDFTCPKCGDDLRDDGLLIRCIERDECGFKIGKEKYEKILSDIEAADLAEDFMGLPDYYDD